MRRGERNGDSGPAVLGVLLTAALVVVDVLVGESPVLISLLVVGPLVTAMRGTARQTSLVAGLALVAAIPLGRIDDGAVLSGEHAIQMLVVALGSGLAVAVATARAGSEQAARAADAVLAVERRERTRSEFLDRASRLLETPPDPVSMLDEIVRLAVPDMAELCLVDLVEEDGLLRAAAVHSDDPAKVEAVLASRERFPIDPEGPHPVAVALREGTPRTMRELTPDVQSGWAESPEHLEAMARQRWASAVIVPLTAGGRTLGVLTFARYVGAAPYDATDLGLAAEVGRRAALALDNARLFSELSRAERQLEAVLENLAEAVTVQAPDGSLLYVNQAAARLLECASPDEALAMPLSELTGRFLALDEHGHPFDFAKLPGRRALAGEDNPEPALMRSISRATGEERWVVTKATAVRDDHGAVAMAVNIMEDLTEERRATRHQRFLSEASALISSSLDIELTLEKLAWAVVPEVADWCCVDLPDERGVLHRRALAADDARRERLGAVREHMSMDPDDPTSLARVLRTGQPILVEDVDASLTATVPGEAAGRAALQASETRSLMCVPLRAGARMLGVITLGTAETRRRLGPEELALAEGLGRRAGIAVENARLHAARTHIATTLQRSLLPRELPEVPGLTSAARFRAAGDTVEVGGDFYDVFPAGDGWMVTMGDVTGKGPTAAAITSMARYTMRTAAMYERTPGAVLARLNAALVADPEGRQLCTAVCVRVDAWEGGPVRAAIACGGHPSPFLLRAGRAEPVGAPGPLLGAFEEAAWSEQHVELQPGESLVLYTDGVTDARGEHGRFGPERLATLLAGLDALDADRIAARIDAELLAFERGPQRDDVALLVLRADAGGVAPPRLATASAARPTE